MARTLTCSLALPVSRSRTRTWRCTSTSSSLTQSKTNSSRIKCRDLPHLCRPSGRHSIRRSLLCRHWEHLLWSQTKMLCRLYLIKLRLLSSWVLTFPQVANSILIIEQFKNKAHSTIESLRKLKDLIDLFLLKYWDDKHTLYYMNNLLLRTKYYQYT